MLVQRHSVRAKTTAYCLLPTVYCLLFTAYCLLPAAASAFCFEEAGKTYDINHGLLEGIAKAESNFNPYAISRNNNGTRDIGLMQINSAWLKTLNLNADLMLSDPCYNLKVGANILRMCIDKYGYTWEAIGCYNATNMQKRMKYSWRVFNRLKDSRGQGFKWSSEKINHSLESLNPRILDSSNSSFSFSIREKHQTMSPVVNHELNMEAP